MRVLVAVDGSENSLRAAAVAAELFGAVPGNEFLVVHVEEDRQWERTMSAAGVSDLAQGAVSLLGEAGLSAAVLLESGQPVQRILAAAQAEKAAVIVMGRRGLNPVARLVTGSVSSGVLNQAAIPVLVVP